MGTKHKLKDIQLSGIRHAKEVICDLLNDQADLVSERDRLRQVNAELVAALGTLIASLEWECNRSGTTYNGYESARAALTAAKGE